MVLFLVGMILVYTIFGNVYSGSYEFKYKLCNGEHGYSGKSPIRFKDNLRINNNTFFNVSSNTIEFYNIIVNGIEETLKKVLSAYDGIEEGVICTLDDTADFDILCWWKANSSKYRILSTIARDVLDVQVSTVASESCFSTSGRVLDAFRSSLSPKMVEALICAQNWLNPAGLKFDEKDFQIFDTTEKIVDDVSAKIVESQGENEMQQV